MLRPLGTIVPLVLCASAAAALVQERVKPKKVDFEETHAAVLRHWKAGQYGACTEGLRELSGLVSIERVKAILAALPAPPEGFQVASQTEVDESEANPMAAAAGGLGAFMGNVVERQYRGQGASIQLTVTADSPLAQMFGMWVANPQMLGPDAELVKYGAHNAVLRKDGNRWNLQVLLNGKHVVDVGVDGRDDEFLLKFLNQAAVDSLSTVLGQ